MNPAPPPALPDAVAAAAAVSFDLFETLFVHPLRNPDDVFDLVGEKLGIPDFRALRLQAEDRVAARTSQTGHRVAALSAIYAAFDADPLVAAAAERAEYDLQLTLPRPNPELIGLVRDMLALERPLALIVDTCMPSAFVRDLLARYGLPDLPAFMSSEHGVTKQDNGALFTLATRTLGVRPDQFLHIGPEADAVVARQAGFRAFAYALPPMPVRAGRALPSTSLAMGLARFHGEALAAGKAYRRGFCDVGPAAVGFLDWIGQRARSDGIDLLLLMEPAGYILRSVAYHRTAGTLPPFVAFRASRLDLASAVVGNSTLDEWLDALLEDAHNATVSQLFERLSIGGPAAWVLSDLGLSGDTVVSEATTGAVRTLMGACRTEILNVCRRSRRNLFYSLVTFGIRPGLHVGLVESGEARPCGQVFGDAVTSLFDVTVTNYRFRAAPNGDVSRSAHIRELSMFPFQPVPPSGCGSGSSEPRMLAAPGVVVNNVDARDDVTFIDGEAGGLCSESSRWDQGLLRGARDFARLFDDVCRAASFDPNPIDVASASPPDALWRG